MLPTNTLSATQQKATSFCPMMAKVPHNSGDGRNKCHAHPKATTTFIG
jgi:hypothetical protein